MKKNKNIEIQIYELLGIKVFRKMAFCLRDILCFPVTIFMSKEKRHELLYDSFNNYNIGHTTDVEKIKKFKYMLLLNASLHLFALYELLPYIAAIINGTSTLGSTITTIVCTIINTYCIMLQRYNQIKLNRFITKMTPLHEKKKDNL